MEFAEAVRAGVVLLAVGVAAFTDARRFKIYNVVTVPLIVSGLTFHLATAGGAGLGFSAAGAIFGLLALLPAFVLGAIGAGDVKLIAGIGAWFGPWSTAVVFLVAALAGAAYSIALMMQQRRLKDSLLGVRLAVYQVATLGKHLGAEEGVSEVAVKAERRRRLVPFAVMIALAVIVVMLWTHL